MANAQRQYEPFTLFNVRIVDMRHLWNPSDEYKGKKQERPNYFAGFIVPKTQAQWHLEPSLAGLVQAFGKLYAGQGPQIVDWRVADGDLPNEEGKSSEFAKGHWLFGGSSGNPITVEIVQAGGVPTKLPNKVGVKSGDYCTIGGTVAVSGQNNRAAKIYLNAVVFCQPGEEIVFANSVSGLELMRAAEQQGYRPAGFSASPGGFGGGQPGGFPGAGGPDQGGAPFGGQNGQGPHQGAPPFGAQTTGNPAFGGQAQGQNGPGAFGGAASPSSGQPFPGGPQGGSPFGR